MYQQGDIVPKDLDAAIAIFKPPCDRGKLEVCVALGELYEKDRDDPATALLHFQKACTGGFDEACASVQRLKQK